MPRPDPAPPPDRPASATTSIGLLARLLRSGDGAWPDDVDPEDVLRACRSEECSAYVVNHGRSRPGYGSWPAGLRDTLEAEAREAAAREVIAREEVASAVATLSRAGITPLVFKGTALAYQVYEVPSLRSRCDTDLLIRRGERDRARRALHDAGYVSPPYSGGDVLFGQFPLVRTDRFGMEHWLDVHWEISAAKVFAGLLDYDTLAGRAAPIEPLGSGVRAPGTVHALLLACVHPAMHHRNRPRLAWLLDVHLLASRLGSAEWPDFTALAGEKRVRAVCSAALGRTAALLGTPVPETVTAALLPAAGEPEPSAAYLDESRSWVDEVAADLRALPTWRERIRLAREIALPPADYLLASYCLPKTAASRAALPALYLHRGVRGVWKVLRGNK